VIWADSRSDEIVARVAVIPAQVGISLNSLRDSLLRGNDRKWLLSRNDQKPSYSALPSAASPIARIIPGFGAGEGGQALRLWVSPSPSTASASL